MIDIDESGLRTLARAIPNIFGWRDRSLMTLGSMIWDLTFKAAMPADKVARSCDEFVHAIWSTVASQSESKISPQELVSTVRLASIEAFFATSWAHAGFPKLIPRSHRYAAALMATHANLDATEGFHRAFLVALPPGLLSFPDGPTVDRIAFYETLDIPIVESSWPEWTAPAGLIAYGYSRQTGILPDTRVSMLLGSSGLDLLKEKLSDRVLTDHSPFLEDEHVDAMSRFWLLARRLVVGLSLALEDRENFQEHRSGSATPNKRGCLDSPHRSFLVGEPIKIDCRSALLAFQKGTTRSAPTVQSFVAGHKKRQPHGPHSSLRRVIWIRPYWRGDEDAPILARPRVVGPAEA